MANLRKWKQVNREKEKLSSLTEIIVNQNSAEGETLMNDVKKCAKCGGKMVKGSDQTLDDAFRCTRGGTEGPKRLEKYNFRIQPYYCEECGYIEFYKENRK